jgi:hypothetical protein
VFVTPIGFEPGHVCMTNMPKDSVSCTYEKLQRSLILIFRFLCVCLAASPLRSAVEGRFDMLLVGKGILFLFRA